MLENPWVTKPYHIDERPVIGECVHCRGGIRGEKGSYGCDAHYDIPDFGLIHWDCLRSWARDYLIEG